jgi:single-stranded-DNA-specific exonuclease
MKFHWTLAPPQPLLVGRLASQLNISPLLTQCLLNRGFSEPEPIRNFLQPRLKNLADPFLIPNMSKAVERLFKARECDEHLVIFGDYDVDGVTSTTLLTEVLNALGWKANCYLPHRMDEGYGLSQEGVENCLTKFPATLLLAVDCGSTAVESIAWLKTRGIDVIVLDHHQISNPPPEAVALVNPRVENGNDAETCRSQLRPFTELCSVGLAFKLAHAIVKRGRETGLPGATDFDLKPLLDLVALGTIADLVPLVEENRILVFAGLERLSNTQRPGLAALKQVAKCPVTLGTYEVGFQLGPRLNAAGRLETAEESLHLLRAQDLATAMPIAERLDAQNRERQKIERSIVEQVTSVIRARFNAQTDFVIVEGELMWHIGVVGIVASRVLQEFYRPTIIIGGDGPHWRGSGRSIAGFDLAAALRDCSQLLVRHGGHAMAAGITIHPDNVAGFRNRLNELARLALRPDDLQPPLRLDAEVRLNEISMNSLAELDRLKPTGMGNPAVQFFTRGLSHQRPLQRMGNEKQHVKLWVTDGRITHEAVWWNGGTKSLPVGTFDLAFSPQVSEFNGRRTVQLKMLDWRPTTEPEL